MSVQRSATQLIRHLVLSLVLTSGCGEDDTANGGSAVLQILVEPEDAIADGLEPGMQGEQIRDGWRVRFDKYLASVGEVEIRLATDQGVRASAPEVIVTDLMQVPQGGIPLWEIDSLRSGRYEFYYSLTPASLNADRSETVTAADFAQMQKEQWTYWITGEISKASGESCPPKRLATPGARMPTGTSTRTLDNCYSNPSIAFEFVAKVGVDVGPCEVDGLSGFSIPAAGTQTVAISIHGDHPFFNGFQGADESSITRLAQWLADCDLNLDGVVTQDEFQAVSPSDLAEIDERYALGGSPIAPLESMEDYVRAQLQTQGHFQGEGECPIRR